MILFFVAIVHLVCGGVITYKMMDKVVVNVEEKLKYMQEWFALLILWLQNSEEEKIEKFLLEQGIRRVAIYGMGPVGKVLVLKIKSTKIEIIQIIDQNSVDIKGIRCVRPEEMDVMVDAVILTVPRAYEIMRKNITSRIQCKVLTIEDIIYSLDKGAYFCDE